MNQYYDLHVHLNSGLKELDEQVESAKKLGWNGICITVDFQNMKELKIFSERISEKSGDTGLNLFSGAEITGKSVQGLQKDSRKALDYVDLILVRGGDEINRLAAECWEVDILCHPEKLAGKDFMKQRNSGIDQVMARFMAERLIGMEFNFNEVLNSYGMLRSQILGRMRQNVTLARKYNTLMILTSGGYDIKELRAPRDLIAVGKTLGMTLEEAKKAVSENPSKLLKKSRDRKNPNILLKGLEVVEWGKQKAREKKTYGWY